MRRAVTAACVFNTGARSPATVIRRPSPDPPATTVCAIPRTRSSLQPSAIITASLSTEIHVSRSIHFISFLDARVALLTTLVVRVE